ncbi:MAG: heterodisulfide reductase-related iron-sulfur binding cluster, partial [Gemmatales bacterium]|nr:heterodisulfide reductase-related iron-sulfur binding cluster [Gemmatales bacterium]MDW8174229.1 heterodisulfide reductase-related iron-sulfur binding cluster [Gemmatales bacterium]
VRGDLLRWFQRHQPAPQAGQRGQVLLLADCFTTWSEPQIGRAAVRLLEQAGYRVEIWPELCCGRVLISKGFLDEAQYLVARRASALAHRLRECQAILGVEPGCLLTLLDEWPELYPNPATETIARHTHLVETWLLEQHQSAKLPLSFSPWAQRFALHTHCHQKALLGSQDTLEALRLIPEAQVELLDTSCCGMAGSFGYEHYDVSMAIARVSLIPELEKRPQAVVIASGTSCRHQIHDATGRRAWHPLEILAQQCSFAAPHEMRTATRTTTIP